MKELGEVIKINDNIATVRINRRSACSDCHACSLGMENRKYIDLEVLNTVDAKESDIVELDVQTQNILLAAFIMYGFPLIMMLVGVCSSYYVFAKENTLIATIVGLLCMVISFATIRLNEKKIKHSNKFLPQISRKVSQELDSLIN